MEQFFSKRLKAIEDCKLTSSRKYKARVYKECIWFLVTIQERVGLRGTGKPASFLCGYDEAIEA